MNNEASQKRISVRTLLETRGEADELYQRRIRQIKINEETRKPIQRELDALDAIETGDLTLVLHHKLILEILLG